MTGHSVRAPILTSFSFLGHTLKSAVNVQEDTPLLVKALQKQDGKEIMSWFRVTSIVMILLDMKQCEHLR